MKRRFFALFFAILMFIPVISVRAQDKMSAILNALNERMKSYNPIITLEDNYLEIEWSTLSDSKDTSLEFGYSGDVITFTSPITDNYDEAQVYMEKNIYFIEFIVGTVLKLNGYTASEISSFLSQDEYNPTMEENGFSILKNGESITINNEDSSLTYDPMTISINIKKANINMNGENFPLTNTTIEDIVNYLNDLDGFNSYK